MLYISYDRRIYIPSDMAILKIEREYGSGKNWLLLARCQDKQFLLAQYKTEKDAIADVESMINLSSLITSYRFGPDDTNNSPDNEESE